MPIKNTFLYKISQNIDPPHAQKYVTYDAPNEHDRQKSNKMPQLCVENAFFAAFERNQCANVEIYHSADQKNCRGICAQRAPNVKVQKREKRARKSARGAIKRKKIVKGTAENKSFYPKRIRKKDRTCPKKCKHTQRAVAEPKNLPPFVHRIPPENIIIIIAKCYKKVNKNGK
jgi:hypothetical protein